MRAADQRRGWRPFKLDQLGTVGRGKSKHRPRNDPILYGGLYPFVQTGDVKSASLWLTENEQTYSEFGLSQSKLWAKGTLCITIAANIAETAILGIEACFPDSIVGFLADPEKADVRFIKYYIDTIKLQMQNASHGTTQDNLSVEKLLAFDFATPPLPIQRRIADTLSAYDDLIENNTKRIKILEEMARSLYREWFVNFRFPGHEKTKLVSSRAGKIPEGWRLTSLDEASIYINRGVAPNYADDAPELVINQKCVRDQHLSLEPARRHQTKVPPDKYVHRNDVLINSTGVGTLGRVAQVLADLDGVAVDTHVSLVRPRPDVDPDYFGLSLLALEAHFEAQGAGATGQTELARARIGATPLLLPAESLQRRFGQVVRDLRVLPVMLAKKNDILRATCDLLLPRLISGEIDVSSLRLEPTAS
jgi:type I restriction enzyme S subunit